MPLIEAEVPEINGNSDIRKEFSHYDSANLWNVIFERLKNRSTLLNKEVSCNAARDAQNRWKNRYRDISPYDSTRVLLGAAYGGDYINASYVFISEAPSRKYILTQGPMQQTLGHFWLMVWERRSPVIIMLNRIFEKGTMRCHPYFPHQGGPSSLTFEEVNLRVRLDHEASLPIYDERVLEIIHLQTYERHRVVHMHYTNWPDFGVPSSPSGMLNFLWAVRASGTLNDPDHPPIIHCSAGVGRSGAFVLIDLALFLIQERGSLSNIDLKKLFLDLRGCRMGVIQTAEQLRFCYSAIIRGADELLATPVEERPYIKFKPLPEEENRSSGSNESDDGWDGLEGEYDSSGDEFDAEEVDLDVEEEEDFEDKPELLECVDGGEIRHRLLGLHVNDGYGICPKSSSPDTTNLWLSATRTNDAQMTSSVGVGPETFEHGCAWTDGNTTASPLINVRGSNPSSPKAKVSSSVMQVISEPYLRPAVRDRSNNAVPLHMTDETPSQSVANSTVSADIATQSSSDGESTHIDEVNSKPDGDNLTPPDISRAVETMRIDAVNPNAGTGSVINEYLATSVELRERREARRARQARIREHLDEVRRRMHTADLERKRWLPIQVLRYLRHFFTESGHVHNAKGAVLATVFIVATSVGACAFVYSYLSH
ncbi:unnamed protein product [Calicophoron daubneyi]|uniref:protein-tyrosine-phosphatase n=1 Tax=Calicophoron daubneyi TaxID=300641 RepID=A0AAV2T345_CALDB